MNYFWNKKIIYFDNAATSIRPNFSQEQINNYWKLKQKNIPIQFNNCYQQLNEYFSYNNVNAFAFTPGSTYSINIIVDLLKAKLNAGDEIILSNFEHSANFLPWLKIAQKQQLVIKYFKWNLDKTIEQYFVEFKTLITPQTKIISLTNYSNLIGHLFNWEEWTKEIKKINPNIIFIIDATQYLQHNQLKINNSAIDYIFGSAHKMYGPNGIGFIFNQHNHSDQWHQQRNKCYDNSQYLDQYLIASWTNNLINLNDQWWNNLNKTISKLSDYLIKNFIPNDYCKLLPAIKHHGLFLFKIENIGAEDFAFYLDKNNVVIRAGLSCSLKSHEVFKTNQFCRISFGFNNTISEIKYFLELIKNFSPDAIYLK